MVIAAYGLAGFLERHTPARKGPPTGAPSPREDQAVDLGTAGSRARLLWAKIAYFLEYQVLHSVPKLRDSGRAVCDPPQVTHESERGGRVPTAACARAVCQMDTVAVGHLLTFTGIALYTKEAEVVLPSTPGDSRPCDQRCKQSPTQEDGHKPLIP